MRRSCISHRVLAFGLAGVVWAAWTVRADTMRTCSYDSQGRVRRIQCEGQSVTYTYDYTGRPYSRTESGGSTTKVLHSGVQALAEYGAARKRYVPGPGIDNVLGFHDGAARYLHHDGLNSVTLTTDASNNVIERVTYDSFGAPTFRNADFSPAGTAGSMSGNRSLFTGREWEPDLGVYNYRARFYCPTRGRFLRPDPSGLAGGGNLYAYCGNSPVNRIDPMGLEGCSTAERAVNVVVNLVGLNPQYDNYGEATRALDDGLGRVLDDLQYSSRFGLGGKKVYTHDVTTTDFTVRTRDPNGEIVDAHISCPTAKLTITTEGGAVVKQSETLYGNCNVCLLDSGYVDNPTASDAPCAVPGLAIPSSQAEGLLGQRTEGDKQVPLVPYSDLVGK
jgi:RHS repeat-associated protein